MKKAFILILTLTLLLVPTLSSCKKKTATVEVPATEVKITSVYEKDPTSGSKYAVISAGANGEFTYKIAYTVLPEKATNKEVEFKTDSEVDFASVSSDGTVVFDKAKIGDGKAIKVIVMLKAKPEISDSITIYAIAN